MKIAELLVLHHSHVDIGYTDPQRVVWELHRRCIVEAMDLCERTAAYPEGSQVKWTCEVTNVVLHWLDRASPSQIKRMRKLVENGQFSFGAMWAHWTALHPEDLLIESLQPMKRLRDELGAVFKVGMQTDVNGVAWPVADILLDCGIHHLMMSINIYMGGYPLTRPTIFRWQAPSGREMTVFSGEHYNAFSREAGLMMASVSVERMANGLEAYFKRLEAKGWNHDFAILTATHPVSDDNGPPNPELPNAIRRWNESGRAPFIRLVSLDELSKKIGSLDVKTLPVHTGDWTDFWTNGVAASALDVVMSRRAQGALWSARALATRLPEQARRPEMIQEATNLLHLANEHTWNTYVSTGGFGALGSGRFEPIPEAKQRLYKSEKCAGALSLARMLRTDALDALAGNPAQSPTQEGVLIFNPSQTPRTVCLRLPNELLGGAYPLQEGTKQRFDVIDELRADTTATNWFGPVEVPPLALKFVKISDSPRPVYTDGLSNGPGVIESRFWRLVFGPDTGGIKSLVHLESDRECFDAATGWDLFGPIQETVARQSQRSKDLREPRYDLFQVSESDFAVVLSDIDAWATDWRANHARPELAAPVETSIDGEGIHLHRRLTIPGAKGEMKQTISLICHEPRVRFVAYFNKTDEMNPESLYFTFPFQMENAQAHFDTAGVPVAYDKEQLPGACRDWFTASSFVAVEGSNKSGCVTLACPDAPLFQLGGFNYGRHQRDVSRINQALVMAWPTNNYWNTNFRGSQPGYMRFRYEMVWTPEYQAAAASQFAAAAARPVIYHPVVTMERDATVQPIIGGLGENITLVTLEPDGADAVILGLRNHAAEPTAIQPVFPARQVVGISRLDGLKEKLEDLQLNQSIQLPSRRTTLLRVTFATQPGTAD